MTVSTHDGAKPAASAGGADSGATRGFFFALVSYLMWGFLPLYMKAVAHIPSLEVLSHRILWSVPMAGVLLLLLGRTGDIKVALRSPRILGMAALTATIIAANWGVYVWAIAVERTVETALGYYINPLVTVVMGAVLLGERLSRAQMVAIGLAGLAVVVLTVEAGGLPWISLFLAGTFAVYGYLRKTLPIGPSQGFFLEVAILSVPALAYIAWLEANGANHFAGGMLGNAGLLMLAGPITAIPLILYSFGAKLLRLSTIGIMQYIGPTMITAIAVFVFGEPFGPMRILAFALIWGALIIYTWSMFSSARR